MQLVRFARSLTLSNYELANSAHTHPSTKYKIHHWTAKQKKTTAVAESVKTKSTKWCSWAQCNYSGRMKISRETDTQITQNSQQNQTLAFTWYL